MVVQFPTQRGNRAPLTQIASLENINTELESVGAIVARLQEMLKQRRQTAGLDQAGDPGEAPVRSPRQPHPKGLVGGAAAPLPESDVTM